MKTEQTPNPLLYTIVMILGTIAAAAFFISMAPFFIVCFLPFLLLTALLKVAHAKVDDE
jgi:hypothetical protein